MVAWLGGKGSASHCDGSYYQRALHPAVVAVSIRLSGMPLRLETVSGRPFNAVLLFSPWQLEAIHAEIVGDMSRVTLNFDLSKIPFVLF